MTARVLVIAYFFPPLGGIGTQRTAQFVQYLPGAGWDPVVVSVGNSPYALRDEALVSAIPAGVTVLRPRTVEPGQLMGLLRAVRGLGRRLVGKRQARGATAGGGEGARAGWLSRFGTWVQQVVFVPDARVGWYPFAVRAGLRAAREHRPELIYSSSGPYTANLVARRIARKTGLPWVVDFRDPWLDNHFQPPPTRLHRWLARRWESSCVRSAAAVVCVTPLMTADLQARYPDEPPEKFLTITNGYDPADFEHPAEVEEGAFVVRHVGSLFGGQNAVPFLEGVARAREIAPGLREALQVEFIGAMDRANRGRFEDAVERLGLDGVVRAGAFVPHSEAVRLMQSATVQLLIVGSGTGMERVYTGKIFEYLAARRPILAVAPAGLASQAVEAHKAGVVTRPEPAEIAAALLGLFQRRAELRTFEPEGVEVYDRRRLTAELAAVFARCVDAPG